MGPNQVFSAHFWVYLPSKGSVTSTYGRAFGTYTFFEGTSEIQWLIIARRISGVNIR